MKKTFIDYLRFRFKSSPFEALQALLPAFGFISSDLLELGGEERGKDGWESRRPLILADEQVIAWVDYGGESQRGWARWDMSGEGCSWISDWEKVANAMEAISGQLRRVDIALDYFAGEVTHDDVLAAYQSGLFKRPHVGRSPKLKKVETSCPTDGRTLYIGSRASSRFIRCYEKGWEMLAKVNAPEWVKNNSEAVEFRRGIKSPAKDYYRLEVELKAIDGVLLPPAVLSEPDSFFAGAAPWFETLIDAAPLRPLSPPNDFFQRKTLESVIHHCRAAYGGMFCALLDLYGDTLEAKAKIFDLVCGSVPSTKLVNAGCLSLPVSALPAKESEK